MRYRVCVRLRACFALLANVALGGCTVDVDLEGKPCPCLAGYECIENVCVPASTTSGTGGTTHDCAMGVGAFRATWATPHGIRWEWEPVGEEADFQEYRLFTDQNEDAVATSAATVRTWTSADNPELGVFTLRRTGGEDLVRQTVTDELEANTLYHARLAIVDSSGCVAMSKNIAGKSTTDATSQMSVMHDAPVGNWGELMQTSLGCYAGSGCWTAALDCSGEASCYKNLRCGGLDTSLTNGNEMSAGGFTTAYVAFRFHTDATTQPWWGVIGWVFGDVGYVVEPVIFHTKGDYRLVEVPLAAMQYQGALLEHADLSENVNAFFVGLDGPAGTQVWVDEVDLGW